MSFVSITIRELDYQLAGLRVVGLCKICEVSRVIIHGMQIMKGDSFLCSSTKELGRIGKESGVRIVGLKGLHVTRFDILVVLAQVVDSKFDGRKEACSLVDKIIYGCGCLGQEDDIR